MQQPGWYADVQVPGQDRWWDGTAFTDAVRMTPAPAVATAVRPVRAQRVASLTEPPIERLAGRPPLLARQRDPRLDLAAGRNAHATVALCCGLLSLLGWLIPALLGLVFGVMGLRRASLYVAAGHPPIGRSTALWGLVLSVIGVAVTVLAVTIRTRGGF